MEDYTKNKFDKTEDIRMVNDFRDELERIKQKLASDFTKYSELDKKNKEKSNSTNINQENRFNNKGNEPQENKPKEIQKKNTYFGRITYKIWLRTKKPK